MKILTIIARILLGLIFLVFGSNVFLNFIPMPPPPPGLAGDYTKVFLASGYAHFIGGLQVIAGLFLLIGRFVPLGLTIRNHSQHLGISPLNAARGTYRPRSSLRFLNCFWSGDIATPSRESCNPDPGYGYTKP